MKRIAHSIVWLSLLIALPAHAAGVALRWGACDGTANRNFACDRSTGSEMLVASFEAPSGVTRLSGMDIYLRISSANGTAPSWWQMVEAGTCRRTSITCSIDLSDQTACEDVWNGQGAGGIGRFLSGPNGIDFQMAYALPVQNLQTLSPGQVYGAFKLLVNHQRTTGAGACGGCDTPVCIRLEMIRLEQPNPTEPPMGTPDYQPIYNELNTSIAGMSGLAQVATWQGGTPDCAAGLAKPSTWAELKNRFKSH